jgi:hypothetical protein
LTNRRGRVADNVRSGITLTFFGSRDFIETGYGNGKFWKPCSERLRESPCRGCQRHKATSGITWRSRGILQARSAGDADMKRCGYGD